MNTAQRMEMRRMIRVGLICLVMGLAAGWAVDAAKDFWGVLVDGPIREALCLYDGAAVWQAMNRFGC